jgi:hypothetical protein
MRLFRSSTGRRVPASMAVAIVTVVALLMTGTGVFARLQASLTDPSPAQGHASVIAQGVAETPFDPTAWRVVADTAEPLKSANAVERALGFVVTTTDGVNLADVTTGIQERLAAGEAAFVPEGSIQIRASLTDQNAPYVRVGLVGGDDAQDPGNDDLVFGGEPFTAPEGRRDIDLVRDVLTDGEESVLPASDYPTLVIATTGSIGVDDGSGPVTLTAGQAAEFTGALKITGSGDSSSYVAGIIGPEVPAPPRATGTITLGVYLCAPGVTADQLGDPVDDKVAADCDAVSDGFDVDLAAPDGSTLTVDDASNDEGGLLAWTGLAFGDYSFATPTTLPTGATGPIFVDDDGNVVDNGDLTIDRSAPDAHLDIYLFQSRATGSISVTVYDCPTGVDAAAADDQTCDVMADGTDITLTAPDGSTLAQADANQDGSAFVWSDLGVSGDADNAGDYTVQSTIPEGFGSSAANGASPTDTAGTYTVTLSQDAPNATVEIFNLVQATGTVTVDTVVCPDGVENSDTCARQFGPSGLTGIYIQDSQGVNGALTEANASLEGDGPYVWANVSLGDYGMDTS